jgi:Holliday junction resolvasome RuvABC endonuclease subunit
MTLLAIDPSSTVAGFAIFGEERLVAWGEIDVRKVAYEQRLMTIKDEMENLRLQWGISEVACERAFIAPKINTSALQVAVMSIKLWCRLHKLPAAYYLPNQWKVTAVGNGAADKTEIGRALCLEYPQLSEAGEHVVDAVGIGLHHLGIKKTERMSK